MRISRIMLLSLVTILIYSLIVGYPLLTGFPKGGDMPNHLAKIVYIDKYWPDLPLWNSLWGCGDIFLQTYSPVCYYIAFFIHKMFFVSIFDSVNLMSFASMWLTALGIYFFMKIHFHNEVMALVSSILFLSTPASWNFLAYLGMFPQQVAYPFLIFTLVFLALYYKRAKSKYFAAALLCYALLLLSHIVVGVIGTYLIVPYILATAVHKEGSLRRAVARAIAENLKFLTAGFLITAFWSLPFVLMMGPAFLPIVPREAGQTGANPTLDSIDPVDMLGVPSRDKVLRLTPWLNLLALVGACFTIRRRGISRFLSVLSAILFILPMGPALGLSSIYAVFLWTSPVRFQISTSIFLSMLGGFGFGKVLERLGDLHFLRNRRFSKTMLSALLIMFFIVPTGNYIRSEGYSDHGSTYEFASKIARGIDSTADTRIYVSPYSPHPDFSGLIEVWNLASDKPQVSSYVTPVNAFWASYADEVFVGSLGGKKDVRSLTRWFAIEYFLLYIPQKKPPVPMKYAQEGFDEVWRDNVWIRISVKEDGDFWSIGENNLIKYSNATRIIEASDIPTILVIGDQPAYDDIFRSTVIAGHDCEKAYILRGSEYVDDYPIEELRSFDAVLLCGQKYHNREQAWDLLEKYVREGGGLFIETGYSPESNAPYIPSPSPVDKTTGTDFGTEWHFAYTNNSITQGINFASFAPAIYMSEPPSPWGVSASYNESLRPWANALVWDSGHPVIAYGTYGAGRVIWSGMNMPYHVRSYGYTPKWGPDEGELFLRMIDWVLGPSKREAKIGLEVERPFPERVVVTVGNATENAGLLFREAYYKGWQARIETENGGGRELKIYRAGPDFMYVKFPEDAKPPFRVVFEFRRLWDEYLGILASIVSLPGLMIYGFAPTKFQSRYNPYAYLANKVRRFLRGIKRRLTGWYLKEE